MTFSKSWKWFVLCLRWGSCATPQCLAGHRQWPFPLLGNISTNIYNQERKCEHKQFLQIVYVWAVIMYIKKIQLFLSNKIILRVVKWDILWWIGPGSTTGLVCQLKSPGRRQGLWWVTTEWNTELRVLSAPFLLIWGVITEKFFPLRCFSVFFQRKRHFPSPSSSQILL